MWLFRFAWKNMWRNRQRTIITMAAIFFAVILSVAAGSLKEGIFDNLIKNVVSFYTGYIQIHKKGYWAEQVLDNSFSPDKELEQKILQQKNIVSLAPRLEAFALVSSGNITKGSMVVGIDPKGEDRITSLRSKLISGNYIESNDHAVLLSQGLAERMKLKAHDTVILIGQGYHGATAAGKYSIKGIVKFGSPELNDRSLFMPLPLAQDMYGTGDNITSFVLSLRHPSELEATSSLIQSVIGNEYEVMTWGEILPDIKQHIQTDSNNMRVVHWILYLLISFGIFGTLLMMMVERKFEMGMLVAVGMKKIKLAALLTIESIFTVLCGCILGIILSIPVVYYLNIHPLRMGGETAKAYERFGFEAVFPTSTAASNFINQGIIVLIIGLVLSLYPMYKALRLNPVKAMKK